MAVIMALVPSVHLAAEEGDQLRITPRAFEDGQDGPPPIVAVGQDDDAVAARPVDRSAVSYTHLTLPTIYSV